MQSGAARLILGPTHSLESPAKSRALPLSGSYPRAETHGRILYIRALGIGLRDGESVGSMGNPPNIRRWGLFPTNGPHDAVRRYQLARLEEVALAYPVPGTEPPARGGDRAAAEEPAPRDAKAAGDEPAPRDAKAA